MNAYKRLKTARMHKAMCYGQVKPAPSKIRQTEKMNTNLIDKLKSWDGVHIEYLTNLYNTDKTNAYFFENLVTICVNEQDLQKTMTWLIKQRTL